MSNFYFAYGSNMSSRRLRERITGARAREIAWLTDKRLACNKPGRDGTGKANLQEAHGARAWGVLYRIDDSDWPTLDRFEPDYRRVQCEAQLVTGARRIAQVYLWLGNGADIQPHDWYIDHLLEGAREHCLPDEHIRLIATLRSRRS